MENLNNKSKNNKNMINKKPDKRMPVWALVVTDVLLTGICLCVFALYHHVLPRHLNNTEVVVATVGEGEDTSFSLPGSDVGNEISSYDETAVATDGEDNNSEPDQLPIEEAASITNIPLVTTIPKIDDKKKDDGKNADGGYINYGNSDTTDIFADNFESNYITSEKKTVTEVNSYNNDNIQFTTDKVEIGSGKDKITYYVSDIYVTNVKYLKTAFAKGEYGRNFKETTLEMATNNDALIAINGDYYGNNEIGVVIRNGVLYRSEVYDADLCVLYTDGTMETYSPGEFNLDEVLEKGAWQAWIFGPQLLDGSGNLLSAFNSTYYLSNSHPRTAIGYIEPGHYVFVLVDGRNDGYSRGVTLTELAQIMKDAGCVTAYNLDGGKSSEMVYEDEFVNQPSDGGRAVSDIIYIGE